MAEVTSDVRARRNALSYDEQMQDAQKGCVPCKLCGGKAIITDSGPGSGYYIACENGRTFRKSDGCMLSERRLGGWAYNVMDWWNRLHAPSADLIDRLTAEREALQIGRDEALRTLEVIRSYTDADDATSYRADDREGCLDAVFAEAGRSLAYIAKVEVEARAALSRGEGGA